MNWNRDMSAAPRDKNIRLLLVHPKDNKIFLASWVEPTKYTPKGRWGGWSEGTEAKAWMLAPEFTDDEKAHVGLPSPEQFPIIDDVGSGA